MDTRLRVSVVIPTFNRADLLPAAIDSLLQQTRVPDEIIVVDDGSTDHTQDVLKGFVPPVISVWQPKQGVSAARNRGLELATGDLIAFLDSDDLLAPYSIGKRAAILEECAEYDVVYSNVQMITFDGKVHGLYSELRPGPRPTGNVFANFAQYNLMPLHAFMFRRACLAVTGVFDVQLQGMEDYDFWIRMAAQFRFFYLDEPLAQYVMHEAMTTVRQKREMQAAQHLVQRRIYQMAAFQTLPARNRATVLMKHGMGHLLTGQVREGRQLLRCAISSSPDKPEAYLLWALSLLGGRAFGAFHSMFRKVRGDLTIPGL